MDHQNRIRKLQQYLKEHSFDAFLILTKVNRQYVSGFTGSAGIVIITPSSSPPIPPRRDRGRKSGGGAQLFVDDRYLIRARRESALPVKSLAELATPPGPTRVGPSSPRQERREMKIAIEDRISLREFANLKKDYKGIKWVVTHDVVENLRAVKTAQEIRYISRTQKIVDEIFRHIVGLLKKSTPSLSPPSHGGEKLTEAAISLEMERLAKKLGAQGMAFESIVAWGPNAAAPHHLSEDRKIGRNNFLLLDFGVLINGYHSDFTRTLFIGNPNKKQEKVYNTVLEAQNRAIKRIRDGARAKEIDDVARRFIGSAGFGKYFTHNTGHGVGLEIHELPNFAPNSEDILRSNMIVTVEPGIYIENWGGVRIEDMVLVGETTKLLSKAPRDLRSMIIR